jgi:hypothetical protein
MYFFPRIAVVRGHLPIFLTALFSPYVPYGNMEGVQALVGTDVTAVPIGLFLEIVTGFPDHFPLGKDRKAGNARKIGGIQ